MGSDAEIGGGKWETKWVKKWKNCKDSKNWDLRKTN
jgi:hypothetical protein